MSISGIFVKIGSLVAFNTCVSNLCDEIMILGIISNFSNFHVACRIHIRMGYYSGVAHMLRAFRILLELG